MAEFQYSLQENSCFENYCKQNKLRFDDIRFEYRGKWRRTEEMYESVLEPASIRSTFFGDGMDIVACKGERYGKDGYEIIGSEKKFGKRSICFLPLKRKYILNLRKLDDQMLY